MKVGTDASGVFNDGDVGDAGFYGVFDRVLDQWFLQDGQQCFRYGAGYGKKSGAEAGDRDHGFGDDGFFVCDDHMNRV